MSKAIVIAGFPGVGKTTFYNNTTLDVLDSDSSKFDKDDFPQNYIEHIKKNLDKVDIILVSTHKEVREALKKEKISFIIIVPDKNLNEQTREDYEFFGLDVGEYSGDNKDIGHKHVVSTWQALKNNPRIIHDFQVIIVDEAHGLKGKVLTKLLNEHGKNIAYRFGVTGTLPKPETDAMSVKISVGEVKFEIPAHVLIEQGYLATLEIDVMQLSSDFHDHYDEYLEDMKELPEKPLTYKQFKDAYFPDWTAEKQYMKNEPERLQWIADYIERKRSEAKGNVFCLIDGIAFGKKLTKMIDNAVFVYGKDKMKDRKLVYNLFKENDNLVVIANVQVASTGLDIKRIFNMMFIMLVNRLSVLYNQSVVVYVRHQIKIQFM